MASTAVPDPRNFRSWDEAFQYPLPIVRKLEVQLRKNIDEDRNKLRSLVGASYRDLLGTAGRIIDMDTKIQLVETNLSDVGRRCNARMLERGAINSKALKGVGRGKDEARLAAIGQTKVLGSMLNVVARTVKCHGDLLLAAKLLVLARLLHKSVSESGEVVSVLEELRRKLGTLRKKLLGSIERELQKPKTEREVVVNTLCAYALATSSTPKDVLRHFLQVRYEQLETQSEDASEATLLEMLDLYSQTMLDTREMFPRRFAEALARLAKSPLLQDEHVTAVQELNLDVYGRFIAEDVRTFTPWVQHNQTSVSNPAQGLAAWAKQAHLCLVGGLEACLEAESDASAVLTTRRKVLSKYLLLGSKFRTANFLDSVNKLREVFLQRLEELAVKAADLSGTAIIDIKSTSLTGRSTKPGMWSLAQRSFDPSAGSAALRRAVLQERHGRDDFVDKNHDQLDTWVKRLDACWSSLQVMRNLRWDDELDFDLDDIDEGDEPLQRVLSKNDPERIESRLKQATANALQEAYDGIRRTADSSQDAAPSLRLLRELNQRCCALGERAAPQGKQPKADVSLISLFHGSLAKSVARNALEKLSSSIQKPRAVQLALWDGSPPMPVQPLPATFRFLTELQRAMTAAGEDLWSPAAVVSLKGHLDSYIGEQLENSSEDTTATDPAHGDGDAAANDTDGDAAQGSKTTATNNKKLQRLFDTLYLSRVFSPSTNNEHQLQDVASRLQESLALDAAAFQRLEKSASDYWKRTYLLFGLLAPAS